MIFFLTANVQKDSGSICSPMWASRAEKRKGEDCFHTSPGETEISRPKLSPRIHTENVISIKFEIDVRAEKGRRKNARSLHLVVYLRRARLRLAGARAAFLSFVYSHMKIEAKSNLQRRGGKKFAPSRAH